MNNIKVTIEVDCQKLIDILTDVLSKLSDLNSDVIKINVVKE